MRYTAKTCNELATTLCNYLNANSKKRQPGWQYTYAPDYGLVELNTKTGAMSLFLANAGTNGREFYAQLYAMKVVLLELGVNLAPYYPSSK